MEKTIWMWVAFNALVLGMLALDLGVFHRKAHVVKLKEAAAWSAVWVCIALLYNTWVYFTFGKQAGLEFLTGYLVEKSLAVDNIFVIAMIFSYFAVPAMYQHRVLFWGIVGALVMRGAFIWVGAAMLERFHWTIYVFGGLLLFTGVKMALRKDEAFDPEHNAVVKFARRYLPMTSRYDGQKFWTWENGKRVATPLFLVLLLVEFTDLIFAVDSIPAIFAITKDPFIVYTSNVLAILGLRSMYFLLAGIVDKFVYLKFGLAFVLVFVGAKMMLLDVFKIPTAVSLAVVAMLIGGSVAASLLWPPRSKSNGDSGSAQGDDPRGETDANAPTQSLAESGTAREV